MLAITVLYYYTNAAVQKAPKFNEYLINSIINEEIDFGINYLF